MHDLLDIFLTDPVFQEPNQRPELNPDTTSVQNAAAGMTAPPNLYEDNSTSRELALARDSFVSGSLSTSYSFIASQVGQTFSELELDAINSDLEALTDLARYELTELSLDAQYGNYYEIYEAPGTINDSSVAWSTPRGFAWNQ